MSGEERVRSLAVRFINHKLRLVVWKESIKSL